MEELEVKDYLAAWSDLISLLLISFAIGVAGIDPRRRVWGRSFLRRFFIILAVSLNVIFSAGRLIAEGVLVEPGPREFLVVSVIYCARWIWLYFGISRSRSRKAFEIALHLRRLKTIRLGNSTRRSNSESKTVRRGFEDGLRTRLSRITSSKEESKEKGHFSPARAEQIPKDLDLRWGEKELVIRRGERTVSGTIYWRGAEECVNVFKTIIDNNGTREARDIYLVRLVERELHSSHLDAIGTCDFKKSLDVEGPDGLYKKIYELVMTCASQSSELIVDYSSFISRFEEVTAFTAPAVRVGATSPTDLGNVARRVAADACYFVFHDGAEMRTKDHVDCINKCIENAANLCLGRDTSDGDSIV